MKALSTLHWTKEAPPRLPAKCVLALGAALLIGACASETVVREATLVRTATDAPAPPVDEVVCRNVEVTGTRFPKRECRPASEWGLVDTNDRRGAEEYTRQTRDRAGIQDPVEGQSTFGTPAGDFPTFP